MPIRQQFRGSLYIGLVQRVGSVLKVFVRVVFEVRCFGPIFALQVESSSQNNVMSTFGFLKHKPVYIAGAATHCSLKKSNL